MRVESLTLENYRCFARLDLQIPAGGLLLVGRNGSGKSALLDALAVVLDSAIVAVGSGSYQLTLDPSDVRHEETRSGGSLVMEDRYPLGVRSVLGLEGVRSPFELQVDGESAFAQQRTMATNSLRTGWQRGGATFGTWPLLAYYPSTRTTAGNQSTWADLLAALDSTSLRRQEGYEDSLTGSKGIHGLAQAMAIEELTSLQEGADTDLKLALEQAVSSALEGGPTPRYLVREREVVLQFRDDRRARLSELSDGQRSILNIIADLTIRAHRLNPGLPDPLRGTPGIVLIDELDLHLHPAWQRDVFASFQRTFPLVQFIATTHSPQTLGEVAPGLIRILTSGGIVVPDQSDGMLSTWILEHLMETPPRSEEADALMGRVKDRIMDRDLDEAQSLLAELRTRYGLDPDIQRLAARIEKLALLGS